jgi:predicted nucleotidyltransferase component of viral defense system
MNKLIRQQLELINRKTIQYPLQIAEKDYYLSLAIQLVNNSSLADKLIFKGGTALHHCYLPQKRFSEDLDFTSLDPDISFEEIQEAIELDGTFRVNRNYQSDFTIKIERLQYQGLLGQPGNIKLEVDHHQNVVLPGVAADYHNVWQVDTTPVVMDQLEICAEKIRAVSQRARYRDYYDLYFLINKLGIDLEKALDILVQKEIRFPVIAANIAKNWSIAKEQQDRDLGSIYCSEELDNELVEEMIDVIRFDDMS